MDFRQRLYTLRNGRRDEANAAVERPDAEQWAGGFTNIDFYRLRRHARFWENDVGPLLSAFSDFMAGLHGVCHNWAFVLNGTPIGVECWFGLAHRSDIPAADRPSIQDLLSSEFHDILGEAGRPKLSLSENASLFSISGAPTPPRDGAPIGALDKLCRGLIGASWQYVVHAEAKPAFEATKRAEALAVELTRAGLATKRDNLDLNETTYREAIEALRQRYNDGSIVGLWEVDTFLVSPSKEVAARGAAILQSALGGEDSVPDSIRVLPCLPSRLLRTEPCDSISVLTSRQLAVLTCPPAEEYPGYAIIDQARFGVQPIPTARARQAERQLEIGEILSDGKGTGNMLAMELDDLTAHALIVGVTGAGKTNTCFQLLAQLAAKDVPFLVIESAKSEYRELIGDPRFTTKPRIFTVGNETVAPLRLNPFEVPAGTLVQTHIDYVKELFGAAFVLYPPMPQVLEQGIEEVYKDCGWNLATNRNARAEADYRSSRLFPTLDDLVAKVTDLVGRMNYSAEIRGNVTAGLVNRLDQLRRAGGKGPMFNTKQSLPAEELFGKPCILELKSLVSDDEKAFLIGLILIRLYEYHEGIRESERRKKQLNGMPPAAMPPGSLRHVTLIEEAHRLLRNVGTGSSDVAANPKGRAIEVFSNMLAEIRAYGEGIVLAEQIPVKLVPDAIKNTNLKIVHRMLAEDDRKAVGYTMNLSDGQINHLARLQKGQAIVYSEKLLQPVLLKVPHSPAKDTAQMSDEDLRAISAGPKADELTIANPRLQRELSEALVATYRNLLESSSNFPGFVDSFYAFLEPAIAVAGFSAEAIADLFAQLLDREIGRRGRQTRWPFATIDATVAAGRKAAEALFPVATSREKAKEEGWRAADSLYVELFRAVMRLQYVPRDSLPFWGCSSCRTPCRYRYEIEYRFAPKPEERQHFFEGFRDRNSWPALLAQVEQIGQRAFPKAGQDTQSDAAYCYLVHHLDTARAAVSGETARQIVAFFVGRLRPSAELEKSTG